MRKDVLYECVKTYVMKRKEDPYAFFTPSLRTRKFNFSCCSTRPRCPVFGSNIWTIMGKSRLTAFTIGLLWSLFWDWARTSPDLPSVRSSEIAHLEKGYKPWLVIIIEELLQFTILTLASKKAQSPSALSFERIFLTVGLLWYMVSPNETTFRGK